MRMALTAVLVVGLCAVSSVPGRAASETVTGKVIDLYCYTLSKADTGMDHRSGRECALACVKYEEQPVGILTSSGKVYQFAGGLLANHRAKIVPHLTHTVTVTGEVTKMDGLMVITANDLQMVSK
jgi:hypothetical protein